MFAQIVQISQVHLCIKPAGKMLMAWHQVVAFDNVFEVEFRPPSLKLRKTYLHPVSIMLNKHSHRVSPHTRWPSSRLAELIRSCVLVVGLLFYSRLQKCWHYRNKQNKPKPNIRVYWSWAHLSIARPFFIIGDA
jgi:hypothetical protein